MIEEYSAEGIEEKLPRRLDDDSLAKLQALGYIGSFRASSEKKGENLAAPKDRIELYNEIKLAQFSVAESKTDQAITKIQNVLNQDPSVLEAVYILGNIFSKEKRYEQAIEEYKKGQETAPYNYNPDFNPGLLYVNNRELESAIRDSESCIDKNPDFADVYAFLAKALMDKGEDLDQAVQTAKKRSL